MADEERAAEQQCAASDEQAHRAPLALSNTVSPSQKKGWC